METSLDGCVIEASPPSRGAWIEMPQRLPPPKETLLSPPSRGAWIEMPKICRVGATAKSPPSRGAWIEMAASTTTSSS
mgnify:CR=1 FL=1